MEIDVAEVLDRTLPEVLTPEKFGQFLDDAAANALETVGVANNACHCPIGVYLNGCCLPDGWRHAVMLLAVYNRVVAYDASGKTVADVGAPAWAERFEREVDRIVKPNSPVPTALARSLLDVVLAEVS